MASNTTATQNTAPAQPPPPTTLHNLPLHHRASLAPYLPSHPHPPSISTSSHRSLPSLPSPAIPAARTPLPHLTLTYATSLDSAISLHPGVQTALSGPATKAMTHYLRARHDAVLVGANTAIGDDPGLDCRHVALFGDEGTGRAGEARGGKAGTPVPVVLDPSARWSGGGSSRMLRLARDGVGRGVLWVVATRGGDAAGKNVEEAGGGEVVVLGERLRSADGDGSVEWGVVLEALAARGIRSVMVEGGARVIMDLLKELNQRFVSSVIVTIAPVWLGAGGVVVAPSRREVGREVGRLEEVRWLPMGEDVVMAGKFAGSGGQ